jgi:MFS family permease
MPKQVWLLIIGMLVNVVGSSFLWPLNTIYMNEYLGQTLSMAGFVLLLNAGAGVIGNLVGGVLFDKIGGYWSIFIGSVLSFVTLIGLVLWHGWPTYVWFLILLGFSSGIVFPAMFALVGTIWPEGGRKAFNAIYLAQNLGVAIGPALAGLVASYNMEAIFSINLVMYILFFLIAAIGFRGFDQLGNGSKVKEVVEVSKDASKAPFYSLLLVSLAFLLCWIVYSQWSTTLSTHTQNLGLSLKEYSLLWTINGLMILLLQPIVSPLIKRWHNRVKMQLAFGIIVMMISFFIIIFAENFTMFAVSMIIVTVGEVFVWPAVPTIASQLAPIGRDGFYQGIVNSASTIGKMIGPFFGGVMVDQYGMTALILVLCVVFLVAIIPAIFYDRPMKNSEINIKSAD